MTNFQVLDKSSFNIRGDSLDYVIRLTDGDEYDSVARLENKNEDIVLPVLSLPQKQGLDKIKTLLDKIKDNRPYDVTIGQTRYNYHNSGIFHHSKLEISELGQQMYTYSDDDLQLIVDWLQQVVENNK